MKVRVMTHDDDHFWIEARRWFRWVPLRSEEDRQILVWNCKAAAISAAKKWMNRDARHCVWQASSYNDEYIGER